MQDISQFKVVITDCMHYPIDIEMRTFAEAGIVPEIHACITEESCVPICRDADAVISGNARITRKVIEAMENCKVIVRLGAGYDSIDVQAASEKGIPVCNVPNYCSHEVADHAWALLLAVNRNILRSDDCFRSHDWEIRHIAPMKRFADCTCGLIGFGHIGSLFAKRVAATDCRILVYDPFLPKEQVEAYGYSYTDNVDDIYGESDFISLHLPLNDKTRHFIDKAALQKMKPDAILINVARGALVDEQALADALNEGVIGGAGIDVFQHELQAKRMGAFEEMMQTYSCPLMDVKNDKLVLTPHAAWYSDLSFGKLKEQPCREVIRVLSGQPPVNAVNAALLHR